jgi:hypothetical protein
METPCYVIASNGFRDSVSYEDGWCYGKGEFLGHALNDNARDIIKAHIRKAPKERNGIPLYSVSDHGNISKLRRITLRRGL